MRIINNSLCVKVIMFVIIIINSAFNYSQSKFAFHRNNSLYISTTDGAISKVGTDLKIKESKKFITSNCLTYHTMPNDILTKINISDGMVFYSALQPLLGNQWVFVERSLENSSYNLCLFDAGKKTKEIIFSQNNSPDHNYAFRPIAWSKFEGIVYLEALVFGSATENEGIWAYNLLTKQFSKLAINPSYLTTPILSPSGEYFIYGGTTDSYKELHSLMNIVFIYDIKNNKETIIEKDISSWFSISGWISNDIEKKDIININEEEFTILKKNNSANQLLQQSFELPWNNGVAYYVSRTGTPAPTGSIGSNCYRSSPVYSPHTDVSIDFDSPNGVYDPVRAVAAGTVTYAQFNTGGYGNLVKIKHSDNTFTYYAHLNTISVSVNDVAQQGCEIGDGGTTGNSTGDHIHFEWRGVGEAKLNIYPTFSDCNCQPHSNYCYTSNNITGSCGGCTLTSLTPTLISPGSNTAPGSTISNTTPTLTWNPLTGATNYDVYISIYPYGSSNIVYEKTCVSGTSLAVPSGSLTNGNKYRWNIQANVSCGSCVSLYSSQLYFQINSTTLAAAPTNLVSLSNGTIVNLTFTDNSNNEDGFRIERKTGIGGTYTEIATIGANITSFSNSGLTTNQVYYYRVRAYNSAGNSSYSNEYYATTMTAPSGLSSSSVSSTQINLSWTDNALGETGFKIERKTGVSGGWSTIADLAANSSTYSNTGLTSNTTYYYRVRSYASSTTLTPHYSNYSNESNTTTSGSVFQITLSSSPISGGSTSGGGTYNSGQSVTVTASPYSGYSFTNWKEGSNVVSTNASYTFTISGNRTLVANFSVIPIDQYTLNISATNGTVTKSPNQSSYISGTAIQLTATPNSGYTFSGWSVASGGSFSSTSSPTTTFTITGNATITASFVANPNPTSASIKPVPPAEVSPGTEFWIEIKVGDPNAVTNLFGAGFVLNYNTTYLDYVSSESMSWFGTDLVFLPNNDEIAGKTSIGISRKNPASGISGSGVIARIKYLLNASVPNNMVLNFTLTDITATDHNNATIILNPIAASSNVISGISVWSGDTNNDGKVDQADVLPLGIHWNKTGAARQNATTQWASQSCSPWSPLTATYADANGSGKVDQGDVLPIGQNWGKTHTVNKISLPLSEEINQGYIVWLEKESEEAEKNECVVNIRYEQTDRLLPELRGLSFVVKYDASIEKIDNERGEYFGKEVIDFENTDESRREMGYGIARVETNSQINNQGIILRLRIKSKESDGEIKIENIEGIDVLGNKVVIESSNLKVNIVELKAEEIASDYRLEQNYPNPFNPSTILEYSLEKDSYIKLSVYNALGQEILVLREGYISAGRYKAIFDGKDLPSGNYFYKLKTSEDLITRKMTLIK